MQVGGLRAGWIADMVLLSHDPLDSSILATPCRDELMALGFGLGEGERERRERERRERDKRLHSPLALLAPPHTLGCIVGRDQVAFSDMVLLSYAPSTLIGKEFKFKNNLSRRFWPL